MAAYRISSKLYCLGAARESAMGAFMWVKSLWGRANCKMFTKRVRSLTCVRFRRGNCDAQTDTIAFAAWKESEVAGEGPPFCVPALARFFSLHTWILVLTAFVHQFATLTSQQKCTSLHACSSIMSQPPLDKATGVAGHCQPH